MLAGFIFSIFYSFPACIKNIPCCGKKWDNSLISRLHNRSSMLPSLFPFGARLDLKCKSVSGLFSQNMQIFFDASARDTGIKIRPLLRSYGATSDSMDGPAPPCRSSRSVHGENGPSGPTNAPRDRSIRSGIRAPERPLLFYAEPSGSGFLRARQSCAWHTENQPRFRGWQESSFDRIFFGEKCHCSSSFSKCKSNIRK